MNIIVVCPLCLNGCKEYWRNKKRTYYHCDHCDLIHVPSLYHLNEQEEKTEYDKHQNHPADFGYRKFLSRIFDPVLSFINENARGLDFGCGPGPTLSVMFEEMGIEMDIYDYYYFPDRKALENSYDFITASEVAEHLSQPAYEIDRLWQLLLKGGVLAIMTKRHTGHDTFPNWHYKNDPSHICFYSEKTFLYLGGILKADVEFADKDVCLLIKR
ncbi:MAG: class I SAM-dependent methyltransferase [Desulfotalea sp.]